MNYCLIFDFVPALRLRPNLNLYSVATLVDVIDSSPSSLRLHSTPASPSVHSRPRPRRRPLRRPPRKGQGSDAPSGLRDPVCPSHSVPYPLRSPVEGDTGPPQPLFPVPPPIPVDPNRLLWTSEPNGFALWRGVWGERS